MNTPNGNGFDYVRLLGVYPQRTGGYKLIFDWKHSRFGFGRVAINIPEDSKNDTVYTCDNEYMSKEFIADLMAEWALGPALVLKEV